MKSLKQDFSIYLFAIDSKRLLPFITQYLFHNYILVEKVLATKFVKILSLKNFSLLSRVHNIYTPYIYYELLLLWYIHKNLYIVKGF